MATDFNNLGKALRSTVAVKADSKMYADKHKKNNKKKKVEEEIKEEENKEEATNEEGEAYLMFQVITDTLARENNANVEEESENNANADEEDLFQE